MIIFYKILTGGLTPEAVFPLNAGGFTKVLTDSLSISTKAWGRWPGGIFAAPNDIDTDAGDGLKYSNCSADLDNIHARCRLNSMKKSYKNYVFKYKTTYSTNKTTI